MNQVLLYFPDKMTTKRLIIRPCKPGDGKEVYDALKVSHEELKKWMPFAQKRQTMEEVEANIRRAYADFILREDFRLHMYRREDQLFIGSTGLHRIDWETRKVEIGYWVDSRHQKKGYATEATEALTSAAFQYLKVNRVEIRCDSKNSQSRRIPEKLGYTFEGILRSYDKSADGTKNRDTCVYSVLPHEWNPTNDA